MRIAILALALATASLLQPGPAQWQDYDLGSSTLLVQWAAVGSASYTVTYTLKGAATTLPATSSASAAIPCSLSATVTVSYTVAVGSNKSPASPLVTFLCAGRPKDVSGLALSQEANRLTVVWTNQDQTSVGTPLTYIFVHKFATSWMQIAQLPPAAASFVDVVDFGQVYTYKVATANWVGDSTNPPQATWTVVQFVDPQTSVMGTYSPTALTLEKYEVSVTAKDSSGADVISPTQIFFFVVRDYCTASPGNYECVRVDSSSPLYYPDVLGPAGVYQQMQASGATFTTDYFPTYVGKYAATVELYSVGGLWGEWWDNVHLYGVPDSAAVVQSLQRQWAQYDLITTYASTYVSLKLSGLLCAPVSERLTIFLKANDGIRMFWAGRKVIDMWDECCQEKSFTVAVTKGQFYPVKVEWRQLEGDASFALRWQSASLPKQVVPASSLYYPRPVNSWLLTVNLGQSSAPLCYATGFDSMAAGTQRRILLFSVDAKAALVDNKRDVFTLMLILASNSFSIPSVYDGAGQSHADITLTQAGNYSVAITLYGIPIKGSAYTLEVTPLAASAATSVSRLASFAASTGSLTCGARYSFDFTLYDSYANLAAEDTVDLQITFKGVGAYTSPIGVAPPSDWESVYGRDTIFPAGKDGRVHFVVFRAGSYDAVARLRGVPLAEGAVTLSVTPSSIYAPRCVIVLYQTSVVAGNQYVFYLQGRDEFYNVSKDSLSSLRSIACTARMGTTAVPASSSDSQPGVFEFRLSLAAAGIYLVDVQVNSTPVSNSGFQITVLSTKVSPGRSGLSQVPAKVQAGTVLGLTLTVRDEYSNAYIGDLQDLNVTIVGNYSGLLSSQAVNNNNGTFTVFFQPQRVDNYTLYCSINQVVISGNYQLFTVTQGLIAAVKTGVYLGSSYRVASGTIPIYSYDAFGNSIPSPVNHPLMGFAVYRAQFYGPASYEVVGNFSDFTSYSFDLTPVQAVGTYSVVVGLEQQGGLLGFYYSDKSFTTLVASIDYRNAPSISPQKYSALDSVINFDWGAGGPALLGVSDNFAIKWVGKVLTLHTELLSLIVTADELVRLTWAGTVLFDSITTGVAVPVLRADVLVTRNTLYTLTLEYVELSGAASLKLEWLSPAIARQVVPSTSLFSLLHSETSPVSLSTYSDSIDPGRFTVSKSPTDPFALYEAGQGNRKTFLLTTYDRFHNQLTTSATLSGKFVTSSASVTFQEVSAGLQEVAFVLTDMGSTVLNIFVSIASIQRLVATYSVTVVQGMGTALKSEISDVKDVVAGDLGSLTLTSKDYSGNVYASGGDTITYEITRKTGSVTVLDNTLTDLKNGNYTLTYRIQQADTYTVTFTMNGDSTQKLTHDFVITAGPASAAKSTAKVPATVKLNDNVSLTVQINDQYGNAVSTPQLMYAYLRHQTNEFFNKLQFAITATDATKGTYSGTVNYNIKDADSTNCKVYNQITRCTFIGPLVVEVWLVAQGLIASFTVTSDSSNTPVLTRTDPIPFFNWVTGPVNGVTGNQLSASWIGYILPTSTGTFSFSIDTADLAYLKMFRNNVVEATPGPAEGTVDLTKDKFADFAVTFISQSDSPAFKMTWKDPSMTSYDTLPASVFYNNGDVQVSGAALNLVGES